MSTRASYDELIKHVRSLEEENTHLRRELLFSSSGHLVTRLENEPSAVLPSSSRDSSVGSNRQPVSAAVSTVLTGNGHHTQMTDSLNSKQSTSSMIGSMHESTSQDEMCETDGASRVMASPAGPPSTAPQRQVVMTTTRSTATSSVTSSSHGETAAGLIRDAAAVGPVMDGAHKRNNGQHTGRSRPGRDTNGILSSDLNGRSNISPTSTSLFAEVSAFDQGKSVALDGSLLQHFIHSGGSSNRLITIATQTTDTDLQNQLISLEGDTEGFYGDQSLTPFCHGGWLSVDRVVNSQSDESLTRMLGSNDTASMRSFSSSTNAPSSSSCRVQQQLGTKVEVVYSLLSMLGTHDKDDMSQTLLAMSNSQDSCVAMRQSGCLKLLIQLLHDSGAADASSGQLGKGRGCRAARARAAKALRNIVCANPDSQRSRREERVLRLLEQIRAHCDEVRGDSPPVSEAAINGGQENRPSRHGLNDSDHHVGPAIAALMKLSFNEEYRTAIGTLGGLQAVAELLQLDNESCGAETGDLYSVTLRRYACMVLTNLTYGDVENKSLLCSLPFAILAIVTQLQSPDEDLRQVAASVLRNLSWRADTAGKRALREAGTVTALTQASLTATKEQTLKSVLSALWNVSAHCTENKADVCAVSGSLSFLVDMLQLHGSSSTPIIAENAGGVLCNISSYIAVHEEYRVELRRAGALPILLRQLRSPSLTVVSNACGTLWNLSARCAEDQQALRDLGAIVMLRSLVNSRHRMIAMGSTAALKNLLLSSRSASGGGSTERRNLQVDSSESSLERHNPSSHQIRHSRISENDNGQAMPVAVATADMAAGKDERGSSVEQQRLMRGNAYYSHRDSEMLGREVSAYPDAMQSRSFTGRMSDDCLKYPGATAFPNNGVEVMPRTVVPGGGSFFLNPAAEGHVGTHSVDSSPAVHRRVPFHGITSSAQGYTDSTQMMQPLVFQGAASSGGAFGSWGGGPGGTRPAASMPQSYSEDLNLSRLSKRTENVHLTDLNAVEDEPINFSIKYNVDTPQATNTVRQGANTQQPVNRGLNMSQTQPTPAVVANHQMPIAAHQQMNRQAFTNSGAQTMNCVNPVRRGVQQPGRYSSTTARTEFASGGQFMAERSIGDADQMKNYSLQYTEQYDENEMNYDQPLDYGSRFMEPINTGAPVANYQSKEMSSMRTSAQEPSGFGDEDTLKTFCTEGTPMNYLSTATSMNDLSGNRTSGAVPMARPRIAVPQQPAGDPAADEMKDFSSKYVEPEMVNGGTYKPDIAAGRAPANRMNPHMMSNMRVVNHWPTQQATNNYTYQDVGAPSSMNMNGQRQQYCGEDVHSNCSHASSLSSLKSTEAVGSAGGEVSRNVIGIGVGTNSLGSGRHMQNLGQAEMAGDDTDVMKSKMDGGGSSKASVSGSKTVTFDVESNQVQETPLMFSRCSSLGSLSSFDAHSIHSSVISEYSVRASQVVSPSELPDSPCDTMPPSPSPRGHRPAATSAPPNDSKRPSAFFPESKSNESQTVGHKNQGLSSNNVQKTESSEPQETSPPRFDFSEQSSPMRYCDEGNMSSRTSLSALTVDGEKIFVCKEPRTVPLGEEKMENQMLSRTTISKECMDEEMANDSLEDYDNDSPVSEGEENLLAECISLAMPRGKVSNARGGSSAQIVKSVSDSGIDLQKSVGVSQDSGNAMTNSTGATSVHSDRVPNTQSFGTLQPTAEKYSMPGDSVVTPLTNTPSTHYHHGLQDTDTGGFDSPRKFATEDTPLNYSQMGSLSDLSSLNDDGFDVDEKTSHVISAIPAELTLTSENRQTGKLDSLQQSIVDDLDVSLSDDDEDDEELLSKVIEAAMPKSRKPWKPTLSQTSANKAVGDLRSRQHLTAPVMSGNPRRQARSLDPPAHRVNGEDLGRVKEFHGTRQPAVDVKQVQQAAVDKRKQALDSGVNTSAPLKVASVSSGPNSMSNGIVNHVVASARPGVVASANSWSAGRSSDFAPDDDHVLSYAVEGTPISFSRDLSPLVPRKQSQPALSSVKAEDRSWNSSLSSLSFDSSLNAEPTAAESALLEECINAAMPKNRGKKAYKKPVNQPLRTSPSGSSESSLKRNPVTSSSSVAKDARRLQPSSAINSIQQLKNPVRQPNLVTFPVVERKAEKIQHQTGVQKMRSRESPSNVVVTEGESNYSSRKGLIDEVEVNDFADITKETLPDVCPSDSMMDDDTLPSGPSTEANNTAIYIGPSANIDPGTATPSRRVKSASGVSTESPKEKISGVNENTDVFDTKSGDWVSNDTSLDTEEVISNFSCLDISEKEFLSGQSASRDTLLVSSTPISAVNGRNEARLNKLGTPDASLQSFSLGKSKFANGREHPVTNKLVSTTGSPKSPPKSSGNSAHSKSPLLAIKNTSTPPNARKLSFDAARVTSPLTVVHPHESGSNTRRGSTPDKSVSSPVNSRSAASPSPKLNAQASNVNRHARTNSVGKSPKSAHLPLQHKSPKTATAAANHKTVDVTAVEPLSSPSPLMRKETFTKDLALELGSSPPITTDSLDASLSKSDSDHEVPLRQSVTRILSTFPGYRTESSDRSLLANDAKFSKEKVNGMASSATYCVTPEDQVGSLANQNVSSPATERKPMTSHAVLSDKELIRLALQSSASGLKMISPGKSTPRSASKSAASSPVTGRKSLAVSSARSNPQLNKLDLKDSLPEKKVAKSKISSLWKRDKERKAEKDKVGTKVVNSKTDDLDLAKTDLAKSRSRDGLGKSPKSFRKSFPLRKPKKNNVASKPTEEPQDSETGVQRLTRSGTYDKLTADTASGSLTDSTGQPLNITLPCVDSDDDRGNELMSERSETTSNGKSLSLNPSLSDVNDESVSTLNSVKTAKKRGIFKLFEHKSKSKDSKSKDDPKTADLEHPVASKKKSFFWQRDASSAKKTGKGKSSKSATNEDAIWVKHEDGRELVKSATLPVNSMSLVASSSMDGLSWDAASRTVPQSATIQSLFRTTAPVTRGIAAADEEDTSIDEPSVNQFTELEDNIKRQSEESSSGAPSVEYLDESCRTVTDSDVESTKSNIVTTV